MKSHKMTVKKAAKELKSLDKKVESGKYTEAKHDKKTEEILKKLVKSQRK